MVIFISSTIGFTFLLILNGPINKILEILKKEHLAIEDTYFIKKIDEAVFSSNGLALRKIYVTDKEKKELTFYLSKDINLTIGSNVKFKSVNSIIVSYEVLKGKKLKFIRNQ